MMRRSTRHNAFTLIETVMATVILSAAVVALGAVGTNVLRDTRLNRHYEIAASIIDKQLNMIDFIGIDQFIDRDQMDGVFEDAAPGYRWHVETQYRLIDDLYLVTVSVDWLEGTRPYRLTAQTMFDGTNAAAATGTSATGRAS